MPPTTHDPLSPLSPGPAAKPLDHGLAPSAIGISALVAVLLGGRAYVRGDLLPAGPPPGGR